MNRRNATNPASAEQAPPRPNGESGGPFVRQHTGPLTRSIAGTGYVAFCQYCPLSFLTHANSFLVLLAIDMDPWCPEPLLRQPVSALLRYLGHTLRYLARCWPITRHNRNDLKRFRVISQAPVPSPAIETPLQKPTTRLTQMPSRRPFNQVYRFTASSNKLLSSNARLASSWKGSLANHRPTLSRLCPR